MGVAVLPPQDCLYRHNHHHQPLISPASKNRRNPNPNPNLNRSSRRRNNPPVPVPGQFRILKRGEDVPLPPRKERKPKAVSDTVQSDPKMAPEMKSPNPNQPDASGFYAGSAFITSPPPSSLPVPGFFTQKRNCGFVGTHVTELESELRRVLRLD